MNEKFQYEQNNLLQNYLDRYEKDSESVELIISSECDQKCEYCYLYKHGHKTYTPESNNKDNILHNLPIILEYVYENFPKVHDYDMFSGEFFNLSYWSQVFEILYDFFNRHNLTGQTIGVPTNMSFLWDVEKTQEVEKWIYKFKEQKNYLYLSASVDGPTELEDLERPSKKTDKNYSKTEWYYDTLFKFLAKHQYAAHPMITRNFVKNYKENYDFWIDMSFKYPSVFEKSNGQKIVGVPMFLEVRDAEQWDDESIENYKKFLWYVAEKDLKTVHKGNVQELIYRIADDFTENMTSLGEYCTCQPYIIGIPQPNNRIPCSIQGGPVFRVGDLAIVPCHRTCYPNLVYGHFEMENDKITGVVANNPLLAYKIKTFNPLRSMLRCSSCLINAFCIKGCIGSQYEHLGELFSSDERVCKMFFAKYKTIHEIALHYDLYEKVKHDIQIPAERREFIEYARTIFDRIQ